MAVEDGARRGAVSRTEVVHQPSDAEHALHLIAAQLRTLRNLPAALGAHQRLHTQRHAHLRPSVFIHMEALGKPPNVCRLHAAAAALDGGAQSCNAPPRDDPLRELAA